MHPVIIANTEVKDLFSKSTGKKYRIRIALPINYTKSTNNYPVLYVLDPDWLFGWVTETARFAAFLRVKYNFDLQVPNLIIVGIGYPITIFEQPDAYERLRTNDLTPTKSLDDKEFGGTSGGARKFLRFIRDELMPYINSNYRADSKDSSIAGGSFGGLFALYVLFHQPETFRRYIVLSPSLWWDKKVTFRYEREYASKHTELHAKLFLSTGSRKDGLSNMKEFVKVLERRKYLCLEWESHILKGEGHVSAIGMAIGKGLLSIFSKSYGKRI